jgi:hypothetical protein
LWRVIGAQRCDLLERDCSAIGGRLRHCVIKALDEVYSICYPARMALRGARFAGFSAEQIVTGRRIRA